MTTLGHRAVESRSPSRLLTAAGNPLLHWLLTRSRPPRGLSSQLMVLHLMGRRTGKRYDLVVSHHDLDGRMITITQHGWRHNLRGGASVEVTLAGRRRPAWATLVEDPDQVAEVYLRLVERLGHHRANRLGLRLNVDRVPTHDELREAVLRDGLSVISFELR